MKNATVAIGITTYDDISGPKHANSVFEALRQTDSKLCPEFVNWHEPVNIPILNEEIWTEYWAQGAVLRGNGSAREAKFGGMWRRQHSVQSQGMVNHEFGQGIGNPSTLSLTFRWNKKIDWWYLFASLCDVLTPAYGMLHLFTDAEKKRVELCNFDGPVVGEGPFVNKLSNDGNLIQIDRRKRPVPMRFNYIPELSWANYFGPEFEGLFEPERLVEDASFGKIEGNNTVICISDSLDDIISDHENFDAKRSLLRSAFRPGTFRAVIADDDPRFSYIG